MEITFVVYFSNDDSVGIGVGDVEIGGEADVEEGGEVEGGEIRGCWGDADVEGEAIAGRVFDDGLYGDGGEGEVGALRGIAGGQGRGAAVVERGDALAQVVG